MPSPAQSAIASNRARATVPPTLSFLETLDSANYYAAGAGEQAGTPPFYIHGWLLPRSAGGLSVSRFGFGTGVPNVSGYRFQTAGLNATLNFACASGVGTYVATPNYTISAVNVPLYVWGCHTGTHLRMWVNGVKVGADQAITGFVASSTSPYVGNRPADSVHARQQLGVLGWAYGTGIPTDTEVADAWTAARALGDLAPMTGDTDRVSFKVGGNVASVPAQLGSSTWGRIGTPTLTTGIAIP